MEKQIRYFLYSIIFLLSLTVSKLYWNDITNKNLNFNIDIITPVEAAKSSWGGIRGIASLVRGSNTTMESIINSINTSGVMNLSSYDSTGSIAAYPSYSFRIKLTKGVNTSITVHGVSVTYPNLLEIKNVTNGKKALEFYFDDPKNPSSGVGILMRIRPGQFSSTGFNADELYESTLKQVSGKREQRIRYGIINGGTNTSFGASSSVVSGIVKVKEESSYITVYNVTRTNLNITSTACATNGGTSYFTLAFIAKTASPNYSTALFGWENAGLAKTLCGNNPNPLNFGYFNSNNSGTYESDGNSGNDGNHPATSDVDALYTAGDTDATKANVDTIEVGGTRMDFVSPNSL